jgi:hypothetical protein
MRTENGAEGVKICSVLGFKLESQLLEIEVVQRFDYVLRCVKKTHIPPLPHAIAIASLTLAVVSNSHPNGDDPLF